MAGAVTRARVLVVDDDRHAAALLVQLLAAAGFHGASVPDPRPAVEVVRTESVDVVLASFSGRGIGATTELVVALRGRPEPRLADVAIVALVEHRSDAEFGLAAEADAVLVRPVLSEQLVDTLTEVAALDPARRRARRRASHARLAQVGSGVFSE